jgi:predicted glycosyltransferase
MTTPPTVLFNAPNHIGLGHIARLSAVALALREMDGNIRSIFAIEGASHALVDALGLPFVALPSGHRMHKTLDWAAWSERERSILSLQISRSLVRSINPQLAVFDCFPSRAVITAAIQHNIPAILFLREMQDFSRYLSLVKDSLEHVALILVPHDAGSFRVPEVIRMKSCFIGKVVRPFSPGPTPVRDPVRPRIVITGGGGGFPATVSFYNLAMKALIELRRSFPFLEGSLIAGPLFREWQRLELIRGIRVIPFEADTLGAFCRADLVISASGYNTSAELEQVGVKTIFVPGPTKSDDQYTRAKQLASAHAHVECFDGSSATELARLAYNLLSRMIDVDNEPPAGAKKAAAILSSILSGLPISAIVDQHLVA